MSESHLLVLKVEPAHSQSERRARLNRTCWY